MKNLISKEIETKLTDLLVNFKQNYDFTELEKEFQNCLKESIAPILQDAINDLMYDPAFLAMIKVLAGRRCLKYKEHRLLNVTILNGVPILVNSPYFYQMPKTKRGRKKKGRKKGNEQYCHFGMSAIGFVGHYSQNLSSEIVQMAVLCPSLECCHNLMKEKGVHVDVKTIRRLCRDFGDIGISNRGAISVSGHENISEKTLVVGIDGGRIRERRVKRGKKKAGGKRQGFHTDWKEPKLFTIYLLDKDGKLDKGFTPFHDATMQGKDRAIEILRSYLDMLDIASLAKIAFVGDGAPWIWSKFEELIPELPLQGVEVYQVLDYTHAKQALGEIRDLMLKEYKKDEKLWGVWTDLLWDGDLDAIQNLILHQTEGKKRERAMKKFNNYFRKNQMRMQYSQFKQQNVPCGSGCVESAIRRVINMRIKAPGSFWLSEMAERFLFLRSQLISGRWPVFVQNIRKIILENDNEVDKRNHNLCQKTKGVINAA